MSADELYSLISKTAESRYLLTDDDYGFCLIRRTDVLDDGKGRFAIRFRLPHEQGRYALDIVADSVCRALECEKELYVKIEREYGIPYLDCAWIIDLAAKVKWA